MTDDAGNAKLEAIGRLSLWTMAFEHVWHLLGVAERARAAAKDSQRRQREEEWRLRFSDFIKTVPGPDTNSFYAELETLHPCPFPKFGECHSIYENHILLAAVIFGQVYNSGRQHNGTVASNRSLTDILAEIEEAMLVDTAISRAQFAQLKQQIAVVRNRVVAHADGPVFEMRHGDPISSHKTYYSFTSDISILLWRRAVLGLRNAALQKSMELR